MKYSIEDFIKDSKQDELNNSFFELETNRILEVNLDSVNQLVWAKVGAMIAYNGEIRFTREKLTEHGVGKMLKQMLTGEGMTLMKATGEGQLYLADEGKEITVFDLNGQSITVNGNDLLAFEESVNWDVKMIKKVMGVASSGFFNVTLSGNGLIAITTHYKPLTLIVTPDQPIYTDPDATIAWSGNLQPNLKTDITMRTLLGRGSGESFQMEFKGEGFVIVQSQENYEL